MANLIAGGFRDPTATARPGAIGRGVRDGRGGAVAPASALPSAAHLQAAFEQEESGHDRGSGQIATGTATRTHPS
ncbi:hypothetical protein, partial [Rhodanobacter sp. PCA2]|uniref:hypothetical protein n=1 Tax=Rhodanobacter sp. PCA2 TaxID=2006117 RepID=UPI001C635B35